MTLPSTGSISMSQVNTELGRSSTANDSLNDASVRTLAGKASGTISFSDLRGKTNFSYTPVDGSYSNEGTPGTYTVSCSTSATWTWTRTAGALGTVTDQNGASFTSGGTATSITFTINGSATVTRSATFSLSSNGHSWTIQVIGDATGGVGATVTL